MEPAQVVAALQAAVRIPTVSHVGDAGTDAGAFDALHAELRRRFPLLHRACEITTLSDAGIGRGLLLRWPGADTGGRPLVLMAHQDVVPASHPPASGPFGVNPTAEPGTELRTETDAGWRHPPFGGDVAVDANGRDAVWGRGTLDCKGSLIAICAAAERLLAGGFSPRRDVWFSFGCDEEVAGPSAAAAAAELVRRNVDPVLVLDEGGAVAEQAFPGIGDPLAVIGVAEKGLLSLLLVATDAGGHASTPTRNAAVARLAKAIVAIDARPFPAGVPPITVRLLRTLAPRMKPPLRQVLSFLTGRPRLLAAVLARLGPETAAMVRTTTSVTMLSGAPAPNAMADRAQAVVNVRVRPGESTASAVQRIRRVVKGTGVAVQELSASEPSPQAPTAGPAFELLTSTTAAVLPDAVPVPYLTMAATDGRFFQQHWDQVYRFTPIRMSRQQRQSLHAADEHIAVEDLHAAVDWYTALLRAG
ncbi:M20/M25/M40 family metallo-hydrolase [Nakamurella aerolata]|uniref:M20/M25/M40 family metallo-hydrolase n=1 Tax=Nakamurella aerolata TaxID=1656892 RepID=A0A849A6H3_9ACTN|nr:M20/M25/M40 family metallo-hydrolase [Nakamurella aerolata]NNG35246.1 M20/M25/M40 family metallo-hydrolase [Nakamurella aerolata]